MFRRILVAYDGSDGARAALRVAVGLVQQLEAELYSISVEEHLPRYAASISEVEGVKEEIDAHFRALTKEARDAAALEGVELETVVRQGHAVSEILAFVREGRFDLLAVGSHGHSRVVEQIIGTTSLPLVRLAPCSALIVRSHGTPLGGLAQVKRILVGVDGSPLGRLAFRAALDLATLCGASVVGVTVIEVSPLARPETLASGYVERLKAAAEEHARSAGVAFEHVVARGHAAQGLRDAAREQRVDLVVLGATGLERPWSPTIGGTASRMAAEAPCSVLLVRSPQHGLHVRDVMVRAVSAVRIDTPLQEVVELLLRRDVKALPVVDARRHVVGIITGGDLLRRGDVQLRLSIKRELDAATLQERLRALSRSHLSARDLMSRHAHTVHAEVDLAAAMRVMAQHDVKRLPVVNEDRELVGIVSRADVLRAIAALPEGAQQPERVVPTTALTVGDAATTDVPVVPPDASAEEVLAAVLETPLRRAVVVDRDGKVLGIVTDRDVLARSAPDTRPWIVRLLRGQRAESATGSVRRGPGEPMTAAAAMAPTLITVRPHDSLVHAVRLMMQHRVKRLIVVDEQGRFRGLVDRREVLRLLAGEPAAGRS